MGLEGLGVRQTPGPQEPRSFRPGQAYPVDPVHLSENSTRIMYKLIFDFIILLKLNFEQRNNEKIIEILVKKKHTKFRIL